MVTPMDNGYVMVAERHAAFVSDYPEGVIQTGLVSLSFDPASKVGFCVVTASVWKNRETAVAGEPPDGTGLSSMPIPGVTSFTKNSEVENCETSAIGRALAAIGYHAKESMASKEEIAAKTEEPTAKRRVSKTSGEDLATPAQLRRMFKLAREAGIDPKEEDGKTLLAAVVLTATQKRSSKQLLKTDMDAVYASLEQMASELDAVEQKATDEDDPVSF